jgi:hypothetical protein
VAAKGAASDPVAMLDNAKCRLSAGPFEQWALRIEDVDSPDGVARHGMRVVVTSADSHHEEASADRSTKLLDSVVAFVRANPDCATLEIKAGVKGRASAISAALITLERTARIRNMGGEGRGKRTEWRAL